GMVYMTPNTPPVAQISAEVQYGNPVHQPTITSPGSTKIMEERVPPTEATVCTMLFSWTVDPGRLRRMAMEMTAAGIEVEKVNPALSPKKTLAAVKINVIRMPRINPRTVSSFCAVGVWVIPELQACLPKW